MTQTTTKPKRTRWGCLSIPIAATLLFAAAHFHDIWYENQPLTVHLRDVFEESGFEIPDYVNDIEGSKGWVDFQGDYQATVTFTVKSDDLEKFMDLPTVWKTPSDFKPIDNKTNFGELGVPVGTYVIEEWTSPSYNCKYAVNKEANRVYFYRSST
jgi:hypothetical protein